MIKKYFKGALVCLMAILLGGCVYDFTPDAEDLQGIEKPLVVIEGDIIVGGETRVVLKSTSPVLSGVEQEPIFYNGSTVWVESESGEMYMGGATDDNYASSSKWESVSFVIDTRSLDMGGKYRLCVSVPDRGEYHSAFKSVCVSPQIDTVTYNIASDRSSVEFEISTHNSQPQPLYCRWQYEDNWESNAALTPYVKAIQERDSIIIEDIDEAEQKQMTRCYSQGTSTGIFIASTEKLSQNVISRERLHTVGANDRRISSMYCITITQTAMDKEAFKYWEGVKASVSGTGGLFAPMPNEVRGNIVSATYPHEKVLGYVNVSTASVKRVFFSSTELQLYKRNCSDAVYPMEEEGEKVWLGLYLSSMRPVRYEFDEKGRPIKNQVYWTSEECVDCRTFSNGSRPDFWPEGR